MPANPFETILAAAGLLVCVALLMHMALGERRRQKLDAAWRRSAPRWRQRVQSLRAALKRRPWLRPAQRPAQPPVQQQPASQQQAAEEAQRAIDRARRGKVDAEREGNVIRPRAFKDKPDAEDRLH